MAKNFELHLGKARTKPEPTPLQVARERVQEILDRDLDPCETFYGVLCPEYRSALRILLVATEERARGKAELCLMDLLEWAKGNRGTKQGNPYSIPEVESGLKALAKLQGRTDWFDAETKVRSR